METESRAGLRALARAHRTLLNTYAVALFVIVGLNIGVAASRLGPGADTMAFASILLFVFVVMRIWVAVLIHALARTLGMRFAALLCGLLALVPIVTFVILCVLSHKATRVLKAAGVHVGPMGAHPEDIA